MARQFYDEDEYDEPTPSRDKRKLKDIRVATKKLTKNELKSLVRSVLKEIIREELVNYINTTDIVRDAICVEFAKYTKSRDFQFLVAGLVDNETRTVRKLVEDIMVDRKIQEQALKRLRTLIERPRKIKI